LSAIVNPTLQHDNIASLVQAVQDEAGAILSHTHIMLMHAGRGVRTEEEEGECKEGEREGAR